MNKKGYKFKNLIGLLFFILAIAFLALLVMSKGSLSAMWNMILGFFK
jgi:hypothetical protein